MGINDIRSPDSRRPIRNLDELIALERVLREGMGKQNSSCSGWDRVLLDMNMSKSFLLYISQMTLLPYKISGENRILLLLDRKDLVLNPIDWANSNNSWEWALIDVGAERVLVRFYENAKEKNGFLKKSGRKVFKKSVLEILWAYLKGHKPLFRCDLKWQN